MKPDGPVLSALIERFFTQRLMQQKRVSPHTIASYRDTFRLRAGTVGYGALGVGTSTARRGADHRIPQ